MITCVATYGIESQIDTLLVKLTIHPPHRLGIGEVITDRREIDQVLAFSLIINISVRMAIEDRFDL